MARSRKTPAKASKNVTTKPTRAAVKKPVAEIADKPRVLKRPQYKSFRLHKRIKHPGPKLPGAFSLFRSTLSTIRRHWKIFAGITIIYAVLSLVLVRGFETSLSMTDVKQAVVDAAGGQIGTLASSATLFGVLVTNGNASKTADGSVYQSVLLVVISLATVWGFRQVLAGKKIRVRETFYKGLYPLAPFVLVMLVMGLQLLPAAIGSWLYVAVIGGGIAITVIEKVLWTILVLLFMVLSLYMITSSIFGLLIVTLPNMTPLKALRSARQLVLHRRWTVLRKLLFLPLALLLLAALIMLPLLAFAPAVAEPVFFVISLFGWVVTLGYVYMLYRELLNE